MAQSSGKVTQNKIRVGVLTVSDSCHAGQAKDTSGPNLCHLTETLINNGIVAVSAVVPDEEAELKSKLLEWCDKEHLDVIFTTGGTGFAPRDITPEVTKSVIEKEAPGLTIAMIKNSLDVTPKAMLSRLVCGIRGSTIIINLPGSKKGSEECFRFVLPAFPHAVDLLKGHKQQVADTHKVVQAEDSFAETQGKASASATPAKIIKLAVRSQENNASKEPWKSPSDTRSWSKLEHGHGSLGPIHIHSPRRTEGNSDLLGRLVIDEREQIEKSTKNKPLTASGLTVCELLKRKRKSEQTSQKEFQASVHGISDETGNLDSEKLETPAKETNLLKQTETNILRKSKASPRTKTQAEKTWHQMPKTRAQKKLYVQQSSRDSQKQNNEGSRLEKECLAKGNRSVESVGKEPKSVESEYSIENDDQRDDDDGFPQGDTDDDVISFTTDMYSDHDLSDTRIISIEPTVHEDIISRPEYYTKQVANHLDKSEFLHKKIFKMLTQDDKALEMDKHVESDKSIEEEKSNEDSGSPLDSTDNGYVYTMACSESAASAASTAQDCRGDMNVENNTPLQGNNADGTDPKSDENPTSTQIGSEMETKTGAQILYELSQRSFTRLVMGNNVQNCDGSQGEIQSSDIGPDGLTVSSEQIVPNENDTKETKAKRKIKSTKAVSHKKHESEVSFAQVGESAKIFLQKHPLLRGIYLNKGKREVKRNLIKLIRHKSAIDKGSYLRNGRINDKNRIDDMFEYTEDGLKKKEEIDENNARDEYVVNWYMWCPGHGNCLRKCGGYGHCVQDCPGSRHKQDRHNCSLMLNWKLYLSDLEKWQIHITGSHIPANSKVVWTLPAPIYQRLDEDTRDLILKYKDKKDSSSIEQMLMAKRSAPCGGSVPSSVKIRRFMQNKKKYQLTIAKQKPAVETDNTRNQNEPTESPTEPVDDANLEVCQIPATDNEVLVVTDNSEDQQAAVSAGVTFYPYEAIPISCPPQQSTSMFPAVISDQAVSVPVLHPAPIPQIHIHHNDSARDIFLNAENLIPSSVNQSEQHMPPPQQLIVNQEEQNFPGSQPVMTEIVGTQLDPGIQMPGSQPGTIIAGHIPQYIQAEHVPIVPQAVQMVPSDFGDIALLFAACQQQQQQQQQQQ